MAAVDARGHDWASFPRKRESMTPAVAMLLGPWSWVPAFARTTDEPHFGLATRAASNGLPGSCTSVVSARGCFAAVIWNVTDGTSSHW